MIRWEKRDIINRFVRKFNQLYQFCRKCDNVMSKYTNRIFIFCIIYN